MHTGELKHCMYTAVDFGTDNFLPAPDTASIVPIGETTQLIEIVRSS